MKNLRLSLLTGIASVAFVLMSATPMVIQAWQRANPQPLPSPNAPSDRNALERLTGPSITGDKSKDALDRENQIEIRLQVQRLYAMATELKDEVDRTNLNTVMNVAVLKRAQEIEKLAKQIRERAKK
jgi:hypothetical protein